MRTSIRTSPRLRLALIAAALLAGAPAAAQLVRPLAPLPLPPTPQSPAAATPAPDSGPVMMIGALLPLTGDSAPYGKEMRQGMELAIAELAPKPPPRAPLAWRLGGYDRLNRAEMVRAETDSDPSIPAGSEATDGSSAAATAPGGAESTPTPSGPPDGGTPSALPGAAGAPAGPRAAKAGPPPLVLRIVLEVADVDPTDLKAAERGFAKVTASGARVVFTASPTPTQVILPLAAMRDILVLHLGMPNDRLPGTGRTLLQVRPSPALRAAGLVDYAWERGIRRLAFVSGGDDFGKAVRATLVPRWRARGGRPVADESLSVEAGDLKSRLVRIARQAPEAICVGFRGLELASVVVALRDAGYPGLLLALDDDRATLLAGGPTLENLVFVSDTFVADPEPAADAERPSTAGQPTASERTATPARPATSEGAAAPEGGAARERPAAERAAFDRAGAFARNYKAKFNQAPTRFAASAYDAVRALAVAMRSGPEGRLAGSGSQLRAALVGRRAFESVFGGDVVVRDDGVVERPLAVFSVTAGQATFVRYLPPAR